MRVTQVIEKKINLLRSKKLLQRVGCDNIVNGPQYDVCGVCGGDNSTCRLVSGLYTKPFLQHGYNFIADIPEQACNLNISFMKKTSNLFGEGVELQHNNITSIFVPLFILSLSQKKFRCTIQTEIKRLR